MTYSFDGFNYVIRLDKGERLSAGLRQFAAATHVEGAWVSGIGSCLEVTLGFYDRESKAYRWQHFEGLREVVSLNGNLALDEDGSCIFHLHGVFGDEQFSTVGGHVQDMVVAATLELFVYAIQKPLRRKDDPATGLKTLAL